VVLIACANVAGLVLVRSVSRRHEFALRSALGAGRGTLGRQVLAESAVLALAGGLLGVGLAVAALRGFVALDPPGLPRVDALRVDGTVLGFALGLTAVAAVLFSLAPLAVRRAAAAAALRESGRAVVGGSADRVRRLLVGGQLALALVLLAGAGLLGRSFGALLSVDPGYGTANLMTTRIGLPLAGYESDERARDFFALLADRVRARPGVLYAGAVTNLPLDATLGDINIRIEGRPEIPEGEVSPRLDWQAVTPGWFDAMGMRILRGRGIEETDDERAPGAVVLNESAVRLHFPDEEPLGQRFVLGGQAGPGMVTVVGVVNDVRQSALGEPPTPSMYLAHRQFTFWNNGRAARTLTLVARVSGDPLALVPIIRREIAAIDPAVPPGPFRTMDQIVSGSLTTPRFALALVGAFALLSLVLATVGIWGVVSYAAEQRTREVGIRMALGAQRTGVLGLLLRQAAWPVAGGLAAGLLGALVLPRALAPLLFGVEPTDPVTLVAVCLAMGTVALLATLLPARRATRVDPGSVLRSE
jgi:putative ABC transport system permease protein